MTEPITLQELADLEAKAIAGDKNARDILDRMAQEEGFTDWESEEKEIAKILQPILSKATEAVDSERARREKTPGMKPVMAFARMMMESKNPAHRAFIGTYPYRNIYAAAKKFEEEAANKMALPETADTNASYSEYVPRQEQSIEEWIFSGLPGELARLVEGIAIKRRSIRFGVGMEGLDTPLNVVSVTPIFVEIRLWRFQSPAQGKVIGELEIGGIETRMTVFLPDSDCVDNPMDGWGILFGELSDRQKIRRANVSQKPTARPATVDQEKGQKPLPEERRKEFFCSQEFLLETIKNKWPQQGYSLSPWIGDNFQFEITKARLPREEELSELGIPPHATMATTFDLVGHITIGRINDQVSTLRAKSSDPDLLQFFDELVKIVSRYIPPRAEDGIAQRVNFPIPGSLADQFETDLNSMEALINRLNTELGIGLEHHGQNARAAVWSAGNCLIVARAVDNRLTELELINFRREQSDQTAGHAWGYLTDRLKNSGIHCQPVQDYERVAKKTLAIFPPSRSAFDDEESYQAAEQAFNADRERRKNMTVEQAAEEILGVKQTVASTNAGAGQDALTARHKLAQEENRMPDGLNRDTKEEWEEKVPDTSDIIIIKNLRRGLQPKDAARSLEVVEKTIYNRESALRKELGSDIVPFRQKWRKSKVRS